MRSDSFEWICDKLRVRTYQGLTETFGHPVGRKSYKKKMSRLDCKGKMKVGNNKFRTGHAVVAT